MLICTCEVEIQANHNCFTAHRCAGASPHECLPVLSNSEVILRVLRTPLILVIGLSELLGRLNHRLQNKCGDQGNGYKPSSQMFAWRGVRNLSFKLRFSPKLQSPMRSPTMHKRVIVKRHQFQDDCLNWSAVESHFYVSRWGARSLKCIAGTWERGEGNILPEKLGIKAAQTFLELERREQETAKRRK